MSEEEQAPAGSNEQPQPAVAQQQLSKKQKAQINLAFNSARNRWSFQEESRGFYLDSETMTIYCWDTEKCILYLYVYEADQLNLLWNAYDTPYLWPMLEWRPGAMPPPKPADCLNAWNVAQPLLVMFLNGKRFTPAKEDDFPDEVVEKSREDFKAMHELMPDCIERLAKINKVGQVYVMRKFKPVGDNPTISFNRYMDVLEKNDSFAPGGMAELSMRLSVDMNGGILGQHIPEYIFIIFEMSIIEKEQILRVSTDAIESKFRFIHSFDLRLGGYPNLAEHHVQIAFMNSRFCICDLGSESGTFIRSEEQGDVRLNPNEWMELVHGLSLRLGTDCILQVELSDFAIQAVEAASVGVPLFDPASVEVEGQEAGDDDDMFKSDSPKRVYKDRAQARRQRHGDKKLGKDGILDTVKRKLDEIERHEAANKPKSIVETEGAMRSDGSFIGVSAGERAGLGFNTAQGLGFQKPEDIVDVQAMSRGQRGRHAATSRYEEITREEQPAAKRRRN